MSEIYELSSAEHAFLAQYLPPVNGEAPSNDKRTPASSKTDNDLPYVTLTYAQSMDSMISLAPGTRTTLSGPETKSMTHYLRSRHDAILVGVGTAVADDPGLNCRYPGTTINNQPRPVIVDPTARWNPSSSKVLQLARAGQGKAPWVFSSVQPQYNDLLIQHGGERLYIEPGTSLTGRPGPESSQPERFTWLSILKALKSKGITSVMIEGGANVISTLLASPHLVDAVIVTIAPTWLGTGGVVVTPEQSFAGGQRVNATTLHNTAWLQFGADVIGFDESCPCLLFGEEVRAELSSTSKAIAVEPDVGQHHGDPADILYALKRGQEAEIHYKKALSLEPNGLQRLIWSVRTGVDPKSAEYFTHVLKWYPHADSFA